MTHDHGLHPDDGRRGSAFWIAVCGFLAVAAFYLWTEHRAHLLGVLPYLILLACPLLHVMHHGHGHGGHGHHGAHAASGRRPGVGADSEERGP